MVSVARVASAVLAATSSDMRTSKMALAMVSATGLLASHCVEITQHAVARHEQVACAVQSLVCLKILGDLMTFTAGAATGKEYNDNSSARSCNTEAECREEREAIPVFFLMRRVIPGAPNP